MYVKRNTLGIGTGSRGGARLELAFETRELRDMCEDEAEARRALGQTIAEMLRNRLADLDSATSPGDLLAGQPRLGEQGDHVS